MITNKIGDRMTYTKAHLGAVREAIAQGAHVQGVFYWSLLDNYEWALGYERRYGMIYVDFESQKRTP